MAEGLAVYNLGDPNIFSDKILNQLPTPVLAVDTDYKILFLNDAGHRLLNLTSEDTKDCFCYEILKSKHCQTDECRIKQVMSGKDSMTVRNELNVNNKIIPVEYTADALNDEKGNLIGALEYIIDITDTIKQEEKLKEQSRTILEISTPVIKLWDRILMLPIVGVVDSFRAQQMMDKMLNEIQRTSSKIIILDIQGVAAVDTAVANHLIKIAKATKLMGCNCVLSGISPAVAQTLVHLGVDLSTMKTNFDLQEAMRDAFKLLDLTVQES